MGSIKKWVSFTILAVMMLALIPIAQAEEEQPKLRNLAKGLDYEWSEGPESEYPDSGNELTDGKYGKLQLLDPAWVGHVQKKTREVVFDLGEKKSISTIKAHFLQDWPTNSILVPLTVSMYVSDDKENWGTLSHKSTELLWGDGPPREEYFVWDGSKDGIPKNESNAKMAFARYVKVTFTMHTRAWTFLDEIEILGQDGKVEGAESIPPEQPAYQQPGDATAGVRNLSLLYNGHYKSGEGDWTKDRIIPNISYVDQNGNPVDWFFDSVLYLGLTSPAGRGFGGGANLQDWNWYLNKTFAQNGDMQQLNEAVKEVGLKLNEPDHKMKVILMVPDPGEYMTDFGDVDGDGISENFNASIIGEEKALANREKVINWWLTKVKQNWMENKYSNLELVGMYWLEEQISTSETGPDLIRKASRLVHNEGLKLFWIPHFLAYKSHMWKDVGIDAAAFQPNYFFEEMSRTRIEDAANLAKQYGMGVEMEFDDRMLTDDVFRQRFIDYLNGGVEYGYMQHAFKAYYQGNNAIYNTAISKDPKTRILYDWLYQFVNGTYVKDQTAPEVNAMINGKVLQNEISVQDTEKLHFTWEVKDDNSGISKVSAFFNGKTYNEGTDIDFAGKPGKHELIITAADLAGNVNKKSYVINVTTSAADMKTHVLRFEKAGEFASHGTARSLQAHLDAVKRFEENPKKFTKHLKNFYALLDDHKKNQLISEKAYDVLKADTGYLLGNLALNKFAESSAIEPFRPDLTPDKAVDGFHSTRWSSAYADDAWFSVDLGEQKAIDTVVIQWEGAFAKKYKILVSDDKENWTNVIKDNSGIIEGQGGKETLSFNKVRARYVKFQGVERATDYGYSFYDFGVYQYGN
ncbi:DUF4855 domain-containing protein [Metabacillus dongyingensis]|uniref:DUF4855 domain-containing protein n=1 Tax=Metabacillus dongyingensis TaxID=2874282 RepID=UPI003B8C381E